MTTEFPVFTDTIPENPKLKIRLSGLGVLCFSEEHNRAESGYLDLEDHDAMFIMTRDSDTRTVIKYASMRGLTVEVATPEKGLGKCFYRDGSPMNFENMLDLAKIYPNASGFDPAAKFQARIFIDDAVYFTDAATIKKVIPFDQNKPTVKFNPRTIGQALFAYVENREVTVAINGETIPLESGETYTMHIQSNCREVKESDFKHYFDILKNPGDLRINLDFPEGHSPTSLVYEMRLFDALQEQFKSLLLKGEEDDKQRAIADFQGRLSFLQDIRCVPKPCLKVVYADEPRSLP
ncbi:MAG: hypothetical protein JSS81_11000 [Acidobacteria bacterium]|nr:hypothetical protein [Acidobacteriota bacterium]